MRSQVGLRKHHWNKDNEGYEIPVELFQILKDDAVKVKKVTEFQKTIYFCFIDYAKAFDCVDHNKLWKFLKEMRIPDHFTCLLRNLYAGQEITVRTRRGTTDWFQIWKVVGQVYTLSPCLFNFYAEYII